MINKIWAGLIIIGIVIAFLFGKNEVVEEKKTLVNTIVLKSEKTKDVTIIIEESLNKGEANSSVASAIVESAKTDGNKKVEIVTEIKEKKGKVVSPAEKITASILDSAELAVEISIGLIGIMTLWLGLMKVAEEAGLVKGLGRLLRPIMKRLFPEIPEDHPAVGSIVANMAANIFGLGNAATPLGIKAMQELQELNSNKEEASNAMVLFLAINTSSLTLVSSSVIAYRVSAGSASPAEIIAPTIVATLISTTVAIISAKTLQKLPMFKREVIGGDK